MKFSIASIGAAVLLASGLTVASSPAFSAACVQAATTTYGASGFSCNVGPVTFSNFAFNITTSNGGAVALGNITPTTFTGPTGDTEYGLTLTYTSVAQGASSTADLAWTYNVAAQYLTDAYLSFTGSSSGSGQTVISETLSNGVTLTLNQPGATTANFAAAPNLFVTKDQMNFTGAAGGFAQTSAMTNAFSVTAVPAPILGAGLPGLFMAGGVLGFWRRRKAKAQA